ncbi:hypothetical protein FRC12_022546 [Ceratobasidium sp. 428]|nr:hypothetical protein FRC12_022546 [Ceratobasidium sp. 428]
MLGGRSSKKDPQPPAPHPTTASAGGGVPDRHGSPKPKPARSSTLDSTLSKPTNQDGHSQGAPERASTPTTDITTLVGPPPPLARNSTTPAPTTAPAPNPVPVQAPVPTPAVVPTPTPAQAPAPASAQAQAQAPAQAHVLPSVPTREKRIGTPQPVDPQAERIQRLEEMCRYYESQAYHRELLSIRNHLQVNDLQEPWQISQKFQEINKKVENVSRNLSEYLADRFSTTVELRASNFVTSQNRLSKTERDPPIPAEDFVDFHCRSLINEELIRTLFDENLFHPVLESGSNKMLSAMYGNVRLQGAATHVMFTSALTF